MLQVLVPSLQVEQSSGVSTRNSYGNYILAGLIIEKVTGQNYPEYLNQNIISPLGLLHTHYCQPALPNLAQGYYFPSSDRQFAPAPLNFSAVFAAGGLCSTAGDLLTWMYALTSGKVVSPASYQQMITPAFQTGGTSYEFGLGLFMLQDLYGQQVDSVGFGISPFAYLIAYPQLGLMIVVLTNTYHFDEAVFNSTYSLVPALLGQ